MAFELTKEQRWEILNSLPESLKSTIFSGDTAEAISSICSLHDVEETSLIASIVGHVLMGLLPPQKVAETIKKRVSASDSIANTLATEIQHYIFDPVMDDILSLYTPEKVERLDNQINISADKSDTKDLYREKVIE
jgi:pyridoxal/pyridoxine/pyridoxamine kinase